MLIPILQDRIEQKIFDKSVKQDLFEIRDDLELLRENFLSIQEYVYSFHERDEFIEKLNKLIAMLPGD